MNELRELIYEEKPSRHSFEVNVDGSLNQLIYNKWLLTRTELNPLETGYYSKITKVLNDAYYFCTVALMNKSRELNISFFGEKFDFSSIVYPLACFYLSRFNKRRPNTNRVITILEGNLFKTHPEWEANYEDIKKMCGDPKKNIEESMFSPRKITPELLSEIRWYKLTGGYKIDEIKTIIVHIAKDDEERKMIAESICYAIEDSEECSPYIDDNGDLQYDCITYPKAKQFCQEIRNDKCADLFVVQQEKEEESNPKDNDFPFKRKMKELLKSDWFDDYSTDSVKYSVEWREKLVDDLIQSEYRSFLLSDWWKISKGNGRRPMVICALMGALINVNVLKCKKKDLAPKLGITNVKVENVTDYMSKKKNQPYIKWLEDYIENNNGDNIEKPFSD